MTTALTTTSDNTRMQVSEVKDQIKAIQHLLRDALQGPTRDHPEGVHYGIVPGTNKPSLLKPGAEKIAMMFRLVPNYQTERIDLPNSHREVIVTCTLTHAPSGITSGQGIGSASTLESKHRYRGAGGRTCPSCGALSVKASKKEFGGGYYCDKKGGGCGEGFKPGTPDYEILDAAPVVRLENPDPADQYNTVLKMAQKRALVAAVLTATAASDIFTQDLEDDPAAGDPAAAPRAPVSEPRAAKPSAEPASTEAEQIAEGVLEDVLFTESKPGAPKPWKKWGLKLGSDVFGTFDAKLGERALTLRGTGVKITWVARGEHKTIVKLEDGLPL